MTTQNVLSSDPEVQGAAVVFTGTRVPLKNFIDYLEAGDSIGGRSCVSLSRLDSTPFLTRELAASARRGSLRSRAPVSSPGNPRVAGPSGTGRRSCRPLRNGT